MRSRYSAYVLGGVEYLLNTWHPDTRPAELVLDPTQRWLGLTVTDHRATGPDRASVVFTARYRWNGRGHRLQETSRFVRQSDRWWYVDGDVSP